MGTDEPGTHAALKSQRGELIDPTVASHHGRIVQTTGDGLLIEFPSMMETVTCAVDLQRGIGHRNPDFSKDQRILLRIGINVGDVIVEDDDIYGDGVNISARPQELADPGGIFISRAARDQVRDKLDLPREDLGEREAKNIAGPLRVFRVPVAEAQVAEASTVRDVMGNELTPPDRPSIAALPFVNMNGDAKQEYFSEGVTEDIITELSRVPELFVIAHNSPFSYKG
jgi:adenylate cyclase